MKHNRHHVGFFLVEGFPLIALAAALDPLRGVNEAAQREIYDWSILSLDGKPVLSSSRTPLAADASLGESPPLSDLFVVAGANAQGYKTRRVLDWLRRLNRQGCRIGGISSGTFVLARAGLLEGKRFAIHWDLQDLFQDTFPNLTSCSDIFAIDGNCVTCAGGTAALDMMLWLVAVDQGWETALEVAEQFIHPRIREGHDHQRQSPQERYGVNNGTLVQAINVMERNLEAGLAVSEIAAASGISQRQLERLFKHYLKCTPSQFHSDLRLRRARHLLFFTTIPILEIAMTCGFGSHSYFTKAYREHFGVTPSEERQARLLAPDSLRH